MSEYDFIGLVLMIVMATTLVLSVIDQHANRIIAAIRKLEEKK